MRTAETSAMIDADRVIRACEGFLARKEEFINAQMRDAAMEYGLPKPSRFFGLVKAKPVLSYFDALSALRAEETTVDGGPTAYELAKCAYAYREKLVLQILTLARAVQRNGIKGQVQLSMQHAWIMEYEQ